LNPRTILLGAQATSAALPVCDHYSGVPARMRKSLALQAELTEEWGACVFDVTLDCEDGAPVGGEAEHAALIGELLQGVRAGCRVGVRVHAVDHPAFEADLATVLAGARSGGTLPAFIMVPKVDTPTDAARAAQAMAAHGGGGVPLHVLIESPLGVHHAFDIAAHPQVQSLSFGLMDFVSAHGGAIPADAMGVAGQFTHPLVLRAKLALASAAHAFGKVPSHCVVTEFKHTEALTAAALKARNELGYTRMWSIHPDQIRPIVAAFAPSVGEVDQAVQVIQAARAADWGPAAVNGTLHDRASYRYYWQILERARQTGQALPAEIIPLFSS
jgi:citrate lyase subunit beta/citryl-CoA lyase